MAQATLPEPLAGVLRAGGPVTLITVGADDWGHAAMTWAVAVAPGHVRFGVDHGSTSLANLGRDGKATLQVVDRDNIPALIKGPARALHARIEAAPFPIAMWEMAVAEVEDQTWGSVVVSPRRYESTSPEAEALRRIEQAILAELRESSD